MSSNLLAVLLDLPGGWEVTGFSTREVVNATDNSVRKVIIGHFAHDGDERYTGQVDLNYEVNQSTGVTSLHSIGYSSDQARRAQGAVDGPASPDTRRAH
jgi:hypothetical protein